MWHYIIVGAGTAGSVLASGLAQAGRKVLLLEAGGRPPLSSKLPAGMVKLFRGPADWAFTSQPQTACRNRVVFTPRGRMLGGCSNMNAMIHQWGHPADFDGWVRQGASGWAWNEVAPVFRAMERYAGPESPCDGRGRTGPLVVSRLQSPHPLARAFVSAAQAVGLATPFQYNGTSYEGAYLVELNHRYGARYSTYQAFLQPALKNQNLEVRTRCPVDRIVFENQRAVGVALSDPPGTVVRASVGVVLCAGAFGTPQLLMLSGIGPDRSLAELGIPVVADSPQVGSNLHDHPLTPLVWRTRHTNTHKSANSIRALLQWLVSRGGLLASNVVEAFAFSRVADTDAPDLELLLATVEWRNEALEPPRDHAFTIGTAVVAPRSRGRLWLSSPSPRVAPCIDFGLLTDPEGQDARVLLAGARLARRLAAAPPLCEQVADELWPGKQVTGDEELLSCLLDRIQTVYHPGGTCRMGTDALAPVDLRLRVRGARGLWVADASVMPTVPRGHPHAAVAMIAQRAVALIWEQEKD